MNINKKQKPVSAETDTGSIMEFLAKQYLEEHPIENNKIKEIQTQMAPYYEKIDLDASNMLFMLVYDLCEAYEDAAFREGLRMGVRLRQEIDL